VVKHRRGIWQARSATFALLLAITLTVTPGCTLLNSPPIAKCTATPDSGYIPLEVTFDASESYDPDGIIVFYGWNFADGTSGTGEIVTHTYEKPGKYRVTLKVTDDNYANSFSNRTVDVLQLDVSGNWSGFMLNESTNVSVVLNLSLFQEGNALRGEVQWAWAFISISVPITDGTISANSISLHAEGLVVVIPDLTPPEFVSITLEGTCDGVLMSGTGQTGDGESFTWIATPS